MEVEVSQCPLWVKSRLMQCNMSCPLYPRKRTCAVQLGMSALGQKADSCTAAKESLVDHLVGAGEQLTRHRETERLCGLEVDDQLELGRLDDGQVSGPIDDATDVDASLTIHICNAGCVAHEAASLNPLTTRINGRD